MASEKRGVVHLRTMSGLVDARRARTFAGALLELSMLEMDRQRLVAEMRRAERRCVEIRARLGEIEKKGQRLQRFVERRGGEGPASPDRESAMPLQVHAPPNEALKRRRLSY